MRERIDELRSDSRAVSPVIGVVLMIAVVVILAAVVGAFATGVFGNQESAPQAAFSYDGGAVVMDSGEGIPTGQLTVNVAGSDAGGTWQNTNSTTGNVVAGSSLSVSASSSDTIRVIWNAPSGGNSATLFETTV